MPAPADRDVAAVGLGLEGRVGGHQGHDAVHHSRNPEHRSHHHLWNDDDDNTVDGCDYNGEDCCKADASDDDDDASKADLPGSELPEFHEDIIVVHSRAACHRLWCFVFVNFIFDFSVWSVFS